MTTTQQANQRLTAELLSESNRLKDNADYYGPSNALVAVKYLELAAVLDEWRERLEQEGRS